MVAADVAGRCRGGLPSAILGLPSAIFFAELMQEPVCRRLRSNLFHIFMSKKCFENIYFHNYQKRGGKSTLSICSCNIWNTS